MSRHVVVHAVALLALCACALLFADEARGQQATEYEVKAEFVERFTRFIEWPAAFESRTTFVIGIAGRSAIFPHLETIVAERHIKGRPAEIRVITDPAQVDGCDLVFIGAGERDHLRAILGRTETRAILTIADTQGFCAAGVLINFYRDGDTVRFEMNESAIDRSGLRVSAKLLKLARIIDPAVQR